MILNKVVLFLFLHLLCHSQGSYQLAVLKYQGGGDWYANPSALKNLAKSTLLGCKCVIKTTVTAFVSDVHLLLSKHLPLDLVENVTVLESRQLDQATSSA